MTGSPKERLAIDPLPGYDPEIGLLLGMLEQGRQRTRERLENLHDQDLDWAPATGENSIGTILYHLAAIELDWLYSEVLEQPFPPGTEALFPDDVRDDEGRLTIARGATLQSYFDRLDTVRGQLLAAFTGMSPAEFHRERDLPDYTVTPAYVLHHLMQHEAEHRGEIGMLRMLMPRP
ncbi:MAG: DinB family protein [Chloroflexia bacterium]|nr:DinB family protein [Chloroflexia bacterium]